jgi:ABC-type Fe3+-citrate transport system substrate-binding protein
MRFRDKTTQDELVLKLKKSKKILWLKKKDLKFKKKVQTTNFVAKLLDKSDIGNDQKADFKKLFESWSKETTPLNDGEVPEYLTCKITFVI